MEWVTGKDSYTEGRTYSQEIDLQIPRRQRREAEVAVVRKWRGWFRNQLRRWNSHYLEMDEMEAK